MKSKPKRLILGILLYLALYLLFFFFVGMLFLLIPVRHTLTIAAATLFGFAFLFRKKRWASAIHMGAALMVLYLLASGLALFIYNEHDFSTYLKTLLPFTAIGAIGLP